MMSKVQSHHLQKPAYIYVRQSTMGQVRHHHESTERQYGLRNRAVEMMWAPERIRILDQDLGQSGAQTTTREDFKTLVADVSLGRVGAIFALEASRLARSNLEWHRLIEICGLTRTLVVDEDGCYDPADFNDALLLGLKATIAHAELHVIRARLQGGKLHKAQKGELRFPLPIGLCYADEGRIVLDPDQEVQCAVRLVFDVFRQTDSAYAVVHYFGRQQLRFPKRAYGGAWDGRLIWGRLNHGRVLDILKNPSYAGAYVFGRHQSTKEVSSAGDVRMRTRRVPLDGWLVRIQNHHAGYVSWPEYERNQQLLENNRTNAEHMLLSGAAREGLALLQGLLLCGRCGRRLTVRYKGNGGIYATYECNARRREGVATSSCMSLRCDLLDTAVSARVLSVLQPAQIEVAVEALRQLEHRDTAMSGQWRMRLERAEYEAQLAQRRYEEVDPSNRLVAAYERAQILEPEPASLAAIAALPPERRSRPQADKLDAYFLAQLGQPLLRGRDASVASQPTISRFENGARRTVLYRMGRELAACVIERHRRRLQGRARRITIDLDPTDDLTHGAQQLTFFNGHYGGWCYLPLLGFLSFDREAEQYLCAAVLRPGKAVAADGTLGLLCRLLPLLRAAFPRARFLVRLDGAFATPEIFDFLDAEPRLDYVVAMAKNAVLQRHAESAMQVARAQSEVGGETAHVYTDTRYAARTWDHERRVVIKAEVVRLADREPRDNPRFVVTNLRQTPRFIYEKVYCARGDIENRIKELLDGLQIDRTSCCLFSANQLRVFLTAAAYVLMQELRLRAARTACARSQVTWLRDRLLKLGVHVVRSVRRVVLHLPRSTPHLEAWRHIALALGARAG